MDAGNCPDCECAIGELHEKGCHYDQCLDCGEKAYSCGCDGDERSIWTGVWPPGVAACRELGWFCKRMFPSQVLKPCPADTPNATEDLGRLKAETAWDRVARRFIKTEGMYCVKLPVFRTDEDDIITFLRDRNVLVREICSPWDIDYYHAKKQVLIDLIKVGWVTREDNDYRVLVSSIRRVSRKMTAIFYKPTKFTRRWEWFKTQSGSDGSVDVRFLGVAKDGRFKFLCEDSWPKAKYLFTVEQLSKKIYRLIPNEFDRSIVSDKCKAKYQEILNDPHVDRVVEYGFYEWSTPS